MVVAFPAGIGYNRCVKTGRFSGFIRREISGVLHIRKAPELKFIADDSTEYSAHISKMLKELDINYDSEEDSDERL